MKFSTDKKVLLDALNKTIKATASRPSVPYLSGILISVSESSVTIFASDLETSIKTKFDCSVENSGEVAVAGKILVNIINAIPDGIVHIFEEGEFLKINSSQSEFKIRKIGTEDFSSFQEIENDQEIIIPGKTLVKMIKKVNKSVSRDESRIVLTGILLTVEEGIITMVSTDSFRLALVKESLEENNSLFEILIPGKIFNEISRMIGVSSDVRIQSSSNQVLFEFDNTKIITRKLEGKFPNYKQLIPTSYNTKIIMDHNELIDSVKRVSLLALNNAAVIIDISADNQSISLNSKTQELGEAKEDILVKIEGENNSIAINYAYFIDGLNSIDSDTVYLEVQDPLRPGIIRAPGEDFIYLVMPVRA